MPENERAIPIERQLFLRSLTVARPGGSAGSSLAAAMRDVYYRQGDRLFEKDSPTDSIYFVVDGSVRLAADGLKPWDFQAPAVVGVFDALADRPRKRSADALTNVHALVVRIEDWLMNLEEHFDFARETMVRVSTGLLAMSLGVEASRAFPRPAFPPGPVARGLNLFERTLALRACPFFRTAGVQATLELAERAREIDLEAEQRLFEAGGPCDCIYVVAGGVVAIERKEPPLRAELGVGSWVGGAGALAMEVAAFDAVAARNSVLLAIDREDIFDVAEDHFDLLRSVLRGLGGERERIMEEFGVVDTEAFDRETTRLTHRPTVPIVRGA